MKKKDLIFVCNKCSHRLFIEIEKPLGFESKLEKLLAKDCPNCGEDGEENWTFLRLGNYEKEYPHG